MIGYKWPIDNKETKLNELIKLIHNQTRNKISTDGLRVIFKQISLLKEIQWNQLSMLLINEIDTWKKKQLIYRSRWNSQHRL